MWSALLILAGLAGLLVGAELLVRGSTALAARLGIRPMVIGLTVVSLATSLPELAIGIDAARQGSPGLAVGNIVGTSVPELVTTLVSTVRGDRDIAISGTYSGCSWASRHQSRCGQRTALSLTSMVELRDVRLTLLG